MNDEHKGFWILILLYLISARQWNEEIDPLDLFTDTAAVLN